MGHQEPEIKGSYSKQAAGGHTYSFTSVEGAPNSKYKYFIYSSNTTNNTRTGQM